MTEDAAKVRKLLRQQAAIATFGSYALRKDYPLRGVGEREEYKIVTREGA